MDWMLQRVREMEPLHAAARRDASSFKPKSSTPSPFGYRSSPEYTTGNVLVFVHGYNNRIDDIMERHNLLQAGLGAAGYQGAIISFDRPCDDSTLNYLEDRRDAKATALRLVDDGTTTGRGTRQVHAREGVKHLRLVDPKDRTQEAFELRDGEWALIGYARCVNV